MHIIHITTGFPPTRHDKAGTPVYRVVKELNSKIDVIVPITTRKIHENILENGNVHWVKYLPKKLCLLQSSQGDGGIPANLKRNPLLIFLFLPMMIGLFTKTIKLLNHNTIIHAHWLPNAFIGLIVKSIKGNDYVITIRGADQVLWKIRILYPIVNWIFKNASGVITVSNSLAEEISKKFDIPHKTFFVPNGVYVPKQNKAKRTNMDKYIILFVGTLIPRKGVQTLIEAFIKLNLYDKTELIIGGAGMEEKNLKSIVYKNNIENYVKFLGELEPENVQNVMLNSDCFVLPSHSEGTPNVIKEAMACGVPVIATNVSGNPELVKNGETGLLFEPGDVNTLSNHLSFAVQKQSIMKEMGKKGKEFILSKKLTWRNCANEYERLYENIQEESNSL